MPLRIIPDNTRIPFMKLARIRTPISLVLIVLSFVLLFTVGLNQGIDFVGGPECIPQEPPEPCKLRAAS